MDPTLHVYTDGAIVIQDDKIAALGHAADLLADHNQSAPSSDVELVDLSGKWVLPGTPITQHLNSAHRTFPEIARSASRLRS